MKVIVAKPRGFCAGVDRAIEMVERALETYGPPIYVRHAIVHNKRVVESLIEKGVKFVEELDEIEDKEAKVIFSAHGVSPAVWNEAGFKNLEVVDAVCPLVTKVHNEVKHYADRDYTIIMIGHRNHVEVIGTSGHAPEKVIVVESVQEAQRLDVPDPNKLAYVTQTTLSVDDTRDILRALKDRFPNIISPSKLDICYATQNRQDAVKALSKEADFIFIMGSPESSNSNRLVEVAKASGVEKAYLIEGAKSLDEHKFTDDMVIGLSSGASTPETVVLEVIARLKELGADSIEELDGKEEHTRFPFPDTIEFTSATTS
ncbi:MAG: 4-hydroxy-3-methylbut-2-enyl diphosphate reductase [Thermodesulfobacteriota bacterium]